MPSDTAFHTDASTMMMMGNERGPPVQVWTNDDDDGRGSNKTATVSSSSRRPREVRDTGERSRVPFPEQTRTPDIRWVHFPNLI